MDDLSIFAGQVGKISQLKSDNTNYTPKTQKKYLQVVLIFFIHENPLISGFAFLEGWMSLRNSKNPPCLELMAEGCTARGPVPGYLWRPVVSIIRGTGFGFTKLQARKLKSNLKNESLANENHWI